MLSASNSNIPGCSVLCSIFHVREDQVIELNKRDIYTQAQPRFLHVIQECYDWRGISTSNL